MNTVDSPRGAGESERAAFRGGSVDEQSRTRLAANGLDYRRLAVEGDGFVGWLQSVARGFQDGERTDEQVAASRDRSGYRRLTGVYDPAGPMADAPVATIASWIGELTVPGGAAIPSCAISAVTVAPTHRRRGVARAMLEGELRATRDAGIPMAMLTVSESPLYGRYGFAPAAAEASWQIETKRASWIGPQPAGRIDFVTRERVRELLPALHERVRRRFPGEIDVPGGHWDGVAGTNPAAEKATEKRAVQYTDAEGEVRGARGVRRAREPRRLHQGDGHGPLPPRRDRRRVRGALAVPPRARPGRRGARATSSRSTSRCCG